MFHSKWDFGLQEQQISVLDSQGPWNVTFDIHFNTLTSKWVVPPISYCYSSEPLVSREIYFGVFDETVHVNNFYLC